MKKVLSIAGSDCSGGAGIQADIKTISAHKMYAMSAVTSLTAQNTTGVYGVYDVTPEFLASQLDCIFTDIFPDSIKIGMVSSAGLIKTISQKLRQYNASNIVADPVMISTSGSRLLSEDALDVLISELLPLSSLITPNVPETEVLSGMKISDENDMIKAAHALSERFGTSVLIKGGHMINDATDILCENGKITRFTSERIDNPNTHGTGCTLSSAIACGLAAGYSAEESIRSAKEYLTGALQAMLEIGHGSGPLDHLYRI